jgi:PleD family two-component response regulator
LAIPHGGTDTGTVTISVGVATLRPWRLTGSDPDTAVRELLDHADKALYAAKSEGRNAISIYRDGAVLLGE